MPLSESGPLSPHYIAGVVGQDTVHDSGRRLPVELEEDQFIYDVTRLFMSAKKRSFKTRWVLACLQEKWPEKRLTREQVYPAVREGLKRGYLVFCPPLELDLAQRVIDQFNLAPHRKVRVVNAYGADQVAITGAHLVYEALVGKRQDSIRIGLGAGLLVRLLTKYLGVLLRADYRWSKRLHVVTLAGTEHACISADATPLSFARYLETSEDSIEIVCNARQANEERLDIAILEAQDQDHVSHACLSTQMGMLLASNASALRSSLRIPSWTHLVLDGKTAREVVESHSQCDVGQHSKKLT